MNDNKAILFNDCDHAFISKHFYDYCKLGRFDHIDGALLTLEIKKYSAMLSFLI